MHPEVEAATGLASSSSAIRRRLQCPRRAPTRLPRDPLRIHAPGRGRRRRRDHDRGAPRARLLRPQLPVDARRAPRLLPRRVQIVWDASGSGVQRDVERELALLDAYFRRARNVGVNLVRVGDVACPPTHFDVRDGDWSALRRSLESTSYDGASNLGAVRHDGVAEEALWFSDGLSTYGRPWRPAFPVPVFAINSAASSHPTALQALADGSGGRSIDLRRLSERAAADDVAHPDEPAGRSRCRERRRRRGRRRAVAQRSVGTTGARWTAHRPHGRGDGAHPRRPRSSEPAHPPHRSRPPSVDSRGPAMGAPHARLARRAAAREQGPHRRARQAVRARHPRDIAPGARAGRGLRHARDRAAARTAGGLRTLARPPAPVEPRERGGARRAGRAPFRGAGRLVEPRVPERRAARALGHREECGRGRRCSRCFHLSGRIAAEAGGGAAAGQRDFRRHVARSPADSRRLRRRRPLPRPSPSGARTVAAMSPRPRLRTSARAAPHRHRPAPASGASESIRAPPLGAGPSTDADLPRPAPRPRRRTSASSSTRPSSSWPRVDAPIGSVPSPISPSSTCRTGRSFACSRTGCSRPARSTLALPVFERVLELAPNEPQSHRDLGLALAQAGQPQAAVDRLYRVVIGALGRTFRRRRADRADGDERRGRSQRSGRPAGRRLGDRPAPAPQPAGRPARRALVGRGQHRCRPARDRSERRRGLLWPQPLHQGGTITRDATGGYGPEEFLLKDAKPGKYRVEAQFFGHRQQVLTTRTGLMLWLSSGFGPEGQKDERMTIRRRQHRRRARRRRRVRGEALTAPRRAAVVSRAPGLALARRCRRRPGLGGELRRDRLDLVLAHVVVHVAPAGEDRPRDRPSCTSRSNPRWRARRAGRRRRSPCRRPRGPRRASRAIRCPACRSRRAGRRRREGRSGHRRGGAWRTKASSAISAPPAADLSRARQALARRPPAPPAIASSRATRSSVVGWVENRPAQAAARKRVDDHHLRRRRVALGGRHRHALRVAWIFCSADASAADRREISAPPRSASNSRARLIAIWIRLAGSGASIATANAGDRVGRPAFAVAAAEEHREVGEHRDRTGHRRADRRDQDVAVRHVRQLVRHHAAQLARRSARA